MKRGVIVHMVQHQCSNPKEKRKESRSYFLCLCILSLSFSLFLLGYDWLRLDLLSLLVLLPKLELRSWPPRARTVAGGVSVLALVCSGLEDLDLGS